MSEVDGSVDARKAVELHLAGAGVDAIAESLGLSVAAAREAVEAGMAERRCTARAGLETELARLDRMLTAVWAGARRGEKDAMDAALKISGRRLQALAALAALPDAVDEDTTTKKVATPLDEVNARRAARGAGAAGAGGAKVAAQRRR